MYSYVTLLIPKWDYRVVIEYFPIISFLVTVSSLVPVFPILRRLFDQRAFQGPRPALSYLLKSLFFEIKNPSGIFGHYMRYAFICIHPTGLA